MMITVKMDTDNILNMLMDRLQYWTYDDDTINLFGIYYEKCLQAGDFDNKPLDVSIKVDNDYVNNLKVIYEDDFDNWSVVDTYYDSRIVAHYGNAYLIQTR